MWLSRTDMKTLIHGIEYLPLLLIAVFVPTVHCEETRCHGYLSIDVDDSSRNIVFSTCKGDLYLFDIEEGTAQACSAKPRIDSDPRFARNNKTVYFSSSEGASSVIRSIDLITNEEKELTTAGGFSDRFPTPINDNWLAIARAAQHRQGSLGGYTWDDWDIFLLNLRTEEVIRCTKTITIPSMESQLLINHLHFQQ